MLIKLPRHSLFYAAFLGGLTLAIPQVQAQAQVQAQRPGPALSTQAAPVFVIKGFNITGENPLADGDTSRVLAPFLRTDATLDTLQKATVALETALRDKGYALHRVVLPPQEIGANVTLNIVKFVIGNVTVEGNSNYTKDNIRASLPELVEGASPNFNRLAVQTAIANESQGKQVQVSLKEADVADKIDAKVIVKETKPWNFSVGLSNTGTTSSGADRFTVSGGHANVFGLDHQFVGAYTTSLERPADVKQIGLNYRVPFYRWGGVLGLSLTGTGWLYPFFGTLLGWMGVALTGTDAGSNALFGNLQKVTAEQLNLSPILMGAANSAGGVMGKMIDAQSIVVSSSATHQQGNEAAIFKAVFWHSLVLATLVGFIVMFYAYVAPWAIPR